MARRLFAQVQRAVPSFLSLQVRLRLDGYPVGLTVTPPASALASPQPSVLVARSSLRVELASLAPTGRPPAQLIFLASAANAFADLARGLQSVLADTRARMGERDSSGRVDVVTVEADLSEVQQPSGLEGLHEFSTVQRAAGMMIEQGHHPCEVHATLMRQAAAVGLTPYAFARRLLDRPTVDPRSDPGLDGVSHTL